MLFCPTNMRQQGFFLVCGEESNFCILLRISTLVKRLRYFILQSKSMNEFVQLEKNR